MVWVAFDRAVRAVEEHGLPGPVERWRELRDRVREEILDKGFDAERGTFTQHYDTREVDASLLTIPLVGFLPGDDPRVLGTIERSWRTCCATACCCATAPQTGVDGLAGDEHPFLACSFWLVSALAAAGSPRRGRGAAGPAVRAGQRRRAAVGGVRRRARADGRQLPAGLQPPDAGAGGAGAALSGGRAGGPAIADDDRASGGACRAVVRSAAVHLDLDDLLACRGSCGCPGRTPRSASCRSWRSGRGAGTPCPS